MFENIERIKAPTREVFFRDYVLPQKPVILTNLFEGQPIEQVADLETVKGQFSNSNVLINHGYDFRHRKIFEALMTGRFDGKFTDVSWAAGERSTLGQYIDHLQVNPDTDLRITALQREMTPEINALYEVPSYCVPGPGEPDAFGAELWLGRDGHGSLLHYDQDGKNLMQYQFFGEKSVILVPPKSSKKLVPISNNCVVSIAHVSEKERDSFVRWVDGYQCVVRTHETLFMPGFIWHSFEYAETSMALTMRFFRPRHIQLLSERFHTDYRKQSLAWKLQDWERAEPRHRAAFERLQEALSWSCSSIEEKTSRIHGLLEEIYARDCSDDLQGDFARSFVDVLAEQVRRIEVAQAGLYTNANAAAG